MKIIEDKQLIMIEDCPIEKLEDAFEEIRKYLRKSRTPIFDLDLRVEYTRSWNDEQKLRKKEEKEK